MRRCLWSLLVCLVPLLLPAARPLAADDPFAAVVGIKAKVPSEARSARNLGTERSGSGIVIDSSGLVVTIGYLIVEASELTIEVGGRSLPATAVAYDHDSGFGLLRAVVPLAVKPMALGRSADLKVGDAMIAASQGGMNAALPVRLAAKERYAAAWEYMLDEALFTAPPHPLFGGAALMDKDAKLVGVGSLILQSIPGSRPAPGNMWVPVDRLKPVLGDLLALGRSAQPPRPWLGINAGEGNGGIVVATVSPGGPAETAGLLRGDVITALGGRKVDDLADFYRRLWAAGPAGAEIPLTVRRGSDSKQVTVRSIDRQNFLKTKSSL